MLLNLSPNKIKPTTKLFNDTYKYKVVVVTALAHWFKKEFILNFTKKLKELTETSSSLWIQLKKEGGSAYAESVYDVLTSITNYNVRVEHPYLHIYTNNLSDIQTIVDLNESRVKFVFLPENEDLLSAGVVFSKRINFQYKITLGQSAQSYDSFVKWCKDNPKIRITKKTEKNLLRARSYDPGYFYVKDDKSMTMVKMFVGAIIRKVETIVNPNMNK